jgi:hypothetical protein
MKFNSLDSNIPFKNMSLNDQKFYFCYTIFSQKKSQKRKRGYLQKSLVLISEFYLPELFALSSNLTKIYFDDEIGNDISWVKLKVLT